MTIGQRLESFEDSIIGQRIDPEPSERLVHCPRPLLNVAEYQFPFTPGIRSANELSRLVEKLPNDFKLLGG